MRELYYIHCNHCHKDKETRVGAEGLCVSCFVAGHRFTTCGDHCRTEPTQTDPRVAQALAIIYDLDDQGGSS